MRQKLEIFSCNIYTKNEEPGRVRDETMKGEEEKHGSRKEMAKYLGKGYAYRLWSSSSGIKVNEWREKHTEKSNTNINLWVKTSENEGGHNM